MRAHSSKSRTNLVPLLYSLFFFVSLFLLLRFLSASLILRFRVPQMFTCSFAYYYFLRVIPFKMTLGIYSFRFFFFFVGFFGLILFFFVFFLVHSALCVVRVVFFTVLLAMFIFIRCADFMFACI